MKRIGDGGGRDGIESVESSDVGGEVAASTAHDEGRPSPQTWRAQIGTRVPWVGDVAAGETQKSAAAKIGRKDTWVRQNWTRLKAALEDIGNDLREGRLTIERAKTHLRQRHVHSSLRPIVLLVVGLAAGIFAALFVRRLDDVRDWLRRGRRDDGDSL